MLSEFAIGILLIVVGIIHKILEKFAKRKWVDWAVIAAGIVLVLLTGIQQLIGEKGGAKQARQLGRIESGVDSLSTMPAEVAALRCSFDSLRRVLFLTDTVRAKQIVNCLESSELVKTGIDSGSVALAKNEFASAIAHFGYALKGANAPAERAFIFHLLGAAHGLQALQYTGSRQKLIRDSIATMALFEIDSSLLLDSKAGEPFVNRSQVLLLLGRSGEAMSDALEATKRLPTSAKVLANLAYISSNSGDLYRAQVYYGRACSIDSLDPYIWFNRGVMMLLGTNQIDSAAVCFRNAVKCDERDVAAWTNLGTCYQLAGLVDSAIYCFSKATSCDHRDAEPWYNRGNANLSWEDYSEALRCYENAIQLRADHFGAWLNRGSTLALIQRYAESLGSFDQALRIGLDSGVVYANRGRALAKLQRFDEARADLDSAVTHGFPRKELESLRRMVAEN